MGIKGIVTTAKSSEFMRASLLCILALGLQACASAYNVHSNPQGANVYFNEPGTGRKIFLGVTPLSYSKAGLPTQQAFTISVAKEGFKPQDVPMAATDESKTIVNVRLKVDDFEVSKSSKELNEIMKKFFRVQQMIYEKQFHTAIIELDKLIKERPDLAQAYAMKGTSYYLLNEMNSAVASWKESLKIDPENVELLKFLQDKKIAIKDVEAKQ
jgi:tetratricopeptide (TPR) repeat protein